MKAKLSFLIALIPLLAGSVLVPLSVAYGRNVARETVPGSSTASIVRTAQSPSLTSLVASSPAILPGQRVIINEILRLLPAPCQDKIQSFYVRYDNPAERGLAGKDTVMVSGNVPDKEFRALLVHEIFGHIEDLGCLQGTAKAGPTAFWDGRDAIYNDDPSVQFYGISWVAANRRRSTSSDEDFVSGYARSDAFEDEAESAAFYFFHREEFRRMAASNPALAKKYAWLQANVFPQMPVYARSPSVWSANNIPWDVTKLPYEWVTDVAMRK